MLGSTLAFASAAAFSGSASDYTVVYGASTDLVAATDLAESLTGTTTTTGGDSVAIEKSSTKFQVGYNSTDVKTKFTSSDLPTVLSDGVYTDMDNTDFDYTQKIDLATFQLAEFDNSDYNDAVTTETPTLGVAFGSGNAVLNYTIDFSDTPTMSNMNSTNLDIMGKTYFVLAASSVDKSLTLLDSATTQTIDDGAEQDVVVDGVTYKVGVAVAQSGSTNTVKLTVDGKTSNSLRVGSTYKVKDGVFIGVKDIVYKAKESQTSNAELSIGKGKLLLTDDQTVELNDNSVDGLDAYITTASTTDLQKIVLVWSADEAKSLTTDNALTMPGLAIAKLSFGGMTFPATETTSIENSGRDNIQLKTVLKDGAVTIDLLKVDTTSGNFTALGEDTDKVLKVAETNITAWNGNTDAQFVATYKTGSEAESVLLEVSFIKEGDTDKAVFKNVITRATKTVTNDTNSVTFGNVEFDVYSINKAAKTCTITAAGSTVFNKLVTADGLMLTLPTNAPLNATGNMKAVAIAFSEEDQLGTINGGSNFTVNIGTTSNNYAQVANVTGLANTVKIGETDKTTGYLYSALATEVTEDNSADQATVDIVYHGEESYGSLFLSTPGAVSSSGVTPVLASALTAADKAKNLLVVGGSCINTLAAKLLTGVETPVCAAEFTAKTTVGAGQYLIQSFDNPYTSGKKAVLIAGYEAADTANAVNALQASGIPSVKTVGPTLS